MPLCVLTSHDTQSWLFGWMDSGKLMVRALAVAFYSSLVAVISLDNYWTTQREKVREREFERQIEDTGGTISSSSLGKCAASTGTFCHREHCELHEMAWKPDNSVHTFSLFSSLSLLPHLQFFFYFQERYDDCHLKNKHKNLKRHFLSLIN